MCHCVVQGEIDAQEDSFKATMQFGQDLISYGHFASEEIKEKVRQTSRIILFLHKSCNNIILLNCSVDLASQ